MTATQNKFADRIRLGVIGCGPIMLNGHADAIAKAAHIQLEALADRDQTLLAAMRDRLHPARTYQNGEDLLNDPRVELVLLAVHDRFHVPLARKALSAGKHVLVEKPLGIDVEECESLRPWMTADRVFAVGCNRRFLPGVQATKRFLREEGGEVISYRSHYYDSTFRHAVTQPNKFPPAIPPGGNVIQPHGPDWKSSDPRVYSLLTHSPHLLDLARYLIGPISAVRATDRESRLLANGSLSSTRGHVWFLELRFTHGPVGQCLLLLPRAGEFEEGFELHSTGGHVTCSYPYIWFQRENTRIYSAASKEFRSPDAQDCHTFRLQLEMLARSILTGAPQVNTNLEDGIACVKTLVAAAYSACNQGEWIDIDSVAGDVANPYLRSPELVVTGRDDHALGEQRP